MGLRWTTFNPWDEASRREVPQLPGLYLLLERESFEVVYIGQTDNLSKRCQNHYQRWHREGLLCLMVAPVDPRQPKHSLLEWETDLLGGFKEQTGKPPRWQYGREPKRKPKQNTGSRS